jgi:hypothetical protein
MNNETSFKRVRNKITIMSHKEVASYLNKRGEKGMIKNWKKR